MRPSGIEAARSFLEDFVHDMQQATNENEFERLLDKRFAKGFPEVQNYRGDHWRRGEIIGEAMKTLSALEWRQARTVSS